jgi:uncharacterized membrane protein required for colicin V production
MGMIRDKLRWNVMKKFVREYYLQVLIITLPLVVLFTWQTFWPYCWDFLEASTLQSVFSTLAGVFGALLGLLVLSVFFLFDTFGNLIDKYVNLTDKSQDLIDKETELRKILESSGVKPKSRIDVNSVVRKFIVHSKDTTTKSVDLSKELNMHIDSFRKDHTESRANFVKRSLYILIFISFVLAYSIFILASSPFLSTNNVIEGMLLIYFGIVIPILGIIFLICFIKRTLTSIEKLYKEYEDWYSLYKDIYKNYEDLSIEIKETCKILKNKIRTK